MQSIESSKSEASSPTTMAIPGGGPDHSKISFTAKGVAHARSCTDIPFAKEVAELINSAKVIEELGQGSEAYADAAWLVPVLEARYKSLVSAIHRSGAWQVLELASGVSLRGLAMTVKDPHLIYVETDLPELTAEKQRLLEVIRERHHIPALPSYHVSAANILSWEDLEAAVAPFAVGEPIAIVHEGLFMYLSHQEKEIAARNIHRLLERFGGVWITPDFAPLSQDQLSMFNSPALAKALQSIVARTGRDFKEASFSDENHIQEFFTRLGFRADVRPQIDGSYDLSSLSAIKISESDLLKLTNSLQLWELRCL